MHIAIKSPIASIIGKTIHNELIDNVDKAVNTTGVKKVASPTPKIIIPTNKNQIPPKTIKITAHISEINTRENIPFEKMNINIKFTIAIINAKSNPTLRKLPVPLNANSPNNKT